MNLVLPKARYCWQITVKTRRDRTSRLQLLDLTTSTRDYTSATSATGRRATSQRYLWKRHFRFRWTTNASFPRRRTSTVSVEQDRAQERLLHLHQPGRELGLGECPTVRAFTLPTWRWTVTSTPACGNRRYTLPVVPSLSRTVFCGKDFQKREDAGDKL